MKNLNLLAIVISLILLTSCAPSDTVLDDGNCTVYMVTKLNDELYTEKYKYYVTDRETGFILFSNTKFDVGDVISFNVKTSSESALEK